MPFFIKINLIRLWVNYIPPKKTKPKKNWEKKGKTEREMVSMSGDRQRSASTSVVQEVNNPSHNKDSSSASSTTAATSSAGAAAASASNISSSHLIKDNLKMASAGGSTTANSLASSSPAACGGTSNGVVPVSGVAVGSTATVNSSTTRRPAVTNSSNDQAQLHNEESPNHIVYRKVSATLKLARTNSYVHSGRINSFTVLRRISAPSRSLVLSFCV